MLSYDLTLANCCIDFVMNLNDNNSVRNANISSSSISTSSRPNAASAGITDSPRRSARLSSRSPQITPRSLNDSTIHRVLSGGVNSAHSPKSIRRKRITTSDVHGERSSSATGQAALNEDDHVVIDDNISPVRLPPEQSDDEVEVSDNNNTSNVSTNKSGLLTRSQVLNYFEQQTDGYKCKTCNKVNILLRTIINNVYVSFIIH